MADSSCSCIARRSSPRTSFRVRVRAPLASSASSRNEPRKAEPSSGRPPPAAATATAAVAGSRAGVVTTVKDFQALADSWCTYHLAVGFEHLYVYFDDPAELDAVGLPSRFPAERLTCIPHDAKLRAEWKKLQMHGAKGSADEYVAYAKNEVQTRQQLNARHAVKLAHARGLDWLLHVDADELFYPGPSGDARAHFASLSTAGAATFCYMNHEAVPETHGIVDPFKEVSLFKRSLELCQPTPEAQEAVGFWQSRQEGSFFYYYDNGKAAVRVHPDARPLSVHEWLPGTREGMEKWFSNMKTPWAGRGSLGSVVKYMHSEACILHYPCYNVSALWVRWKRGNDNYRLRGREEPPPLHAMVCVAADAAAKRGGEAAARETVAHVFKQSVMLSDQREVDFQRRAGVCERFGLPSRLLSRKSGA